jgi:hypothetical protein
MRRLIAEDPRESAPTLIKRLKKELRSTIGMRPRRVFAMKREMGFDGWGKPLPGAKAAEARKQALALVGGVVQGYGGGVVVVPMGVAARGHDDGAKAFPLLVQKLATDSPADFVESVLAKLREYGAANVKVTSKNADWVLLEPAN